MCFLGRKILPRGVIFCASHHLFLKRKEDWGEADGVKSASGGLKGLFDNPSPIPLPSEFLPWEHPQCLLCILKYFSLF